MNISSFHMTLISSAAHVQLTDEILEILSSALHKAPLYRLAMMNVGLGSGGIKLLTSVVEENTHLCNFSLRKNEIIDNLDTLSLVEAVGNHPGIHICSLDECSIGDQLSISPEIVHVLFRLEAIGLGGNEIGSKGAQIISQCLATNPSINFLDLDDNLFNDDDALLFAKSLNDNTNLVDLSLRGNNFTSVGINTLYRSIFDDESLSTVSDSNHTCELKLFDDGEPFPQEIDGEVLLMNDKHFEPDELPDSARELFMMDADTDKGKAVTSLQVEGRKKMKMLHALVGGGTTNEGNVNIKHLNDMPIELLPEVLMFFQDASKYSGTEERNFDMLFQLVRSRPEWAWISSVSNRGSKECLPLKG